MTADAPRFEAGKRLYPLPSSHPIKQLYARVGGIDYCMARVRSGDLPRYANDLECPRAIPLFWALTTNSRIEVFPAPADDYPMIVEAEP